MADRDVTISVIVPTRNRCASLRRTLESLRDQTLEGVDCETIVVDNGSTDDTAAIVRQTQDERRQQIHYCFAETPGLHVGRHRGALEARGEILTFVDDDVILFPGWLQSIADAFTDGEIALVGGKILPIFEADVPDWIKDFKVFTESGWIMGYLSLMDLGDRTREIDPCLVWGCNYSVRKSVLFDCGGFHPDGMPQDLIRFRGDGETALSKAIKAKGHRALYVPEASVNHRIPSERLTVEYFCRRAYNQGISDSFSRIRAAHGLDGAAKGPAKRKPLFAHAKEQSRRVAGAVLRRVRNATGPRRVAPQRQEEYPEIKALVREAYEAGRSFHEEEVRKDTDLLKYVLKENYLDVGNGAHDGALSLTKGGS